MGPKAERVGVVRGGRIRMWLLALLGGACAVSGRAETLSMDSFLAQVRGSGPTYLSARQAVEGLSDQGAQADLIYSPQLVAHAVRVEDKAQQPSEALQQMYGDRTRADNFGVDLVKKWKYGLTTSVGYGWTKTQVDDSLYLPEKYYQVAPDASVTLSLWRDFLGRQTQAQMDHLRSMTESGKYAAAHQREAVLCQARVAYWSLQFARQEVAIRQDTYARAVSLVDWSERRVRLNLVDESEGLQAKAGREVRAIELQQAVERERAARVQFNHFRGVEGNAVPEDLGPLEGEAARYAFRLPEGTPKSWDVRAAEAKVEADAAAWKDAKANAVPDLNAFASYQANGLDGSFDPAVTESSKGRYPTTKVGVQMVIPLDFSTTRKTARGYEKSYRSSEQSLRDQTLQEEQAWNQLKDRLNDVNHRLVMAADIETIQKKKVGKERELLGVGRSTQFQMQSYETDYSMARLQRLGVQAERLFLWAEAEWRMAADRETGETSGAQTPDAKDKREVAQ